ncbi:zinc finger protein ZAT9-like [Durio zibethinus]|uniref:Zinc finger protein ZAT9-like n=1 Tax=Durio zibethinus TaxID=66656 RepID=A0A6P6B5W3_DURZI|nr:zinc finger protein ZAT9-like [Durio zibethinus]XP_022772572.1 zinc finger protein ZAT9-like [Durio zibethinus]
MEKHKCKFCARTFSNGRALGGHMKGHLTNHPLPPKSFQNQLRDRVEAASSSSSSSGEEQEIQEEKSREVVEEKSLVYGLRENPKKSFRFADPEFSFAVDSGSVVQDRESESESRNPTRRRSKRNRKMGINATGTEEIKKPKLLRKPSLVESPTEPEPVSSVSDTPPEEHVAMCLMMLSRAVWKSNNVEQKSAELLEESEEIKLNNNNSEFSKKKIHGKHRCGKCKKTFRSFDTLGEHKRVCCGAKNAGKAVNDSNIFECPFCYRVFGSGQALGGHKRSHLLAAASSSNTATAANSTKFENNLIDLNLPAPLEDDEFSVLSDA